MELSRQGRQTFKVKKKSRLGCTYFITTRVVFQQLENADNSGVSDLFATFRGVVFDGLLKCRDVAEGAEKQDHLLLFIPNGSDLHKKPDRRP